ncbi:MAG TPA: FUSC family protein [Chthoniobacterales bacterium]
MSRPNLRIKWRRAWRTFVSLHSEPNVSGLAWAEGFRGAVGIATPVAAGLLANHLAWGVLAGFAVLWILSCDLGGAYRQKALGMTGSAATMVAAYLFAVWMTWSVPNYLVGTFVWVFSAALIGVAGSAAAQAGLVSSTIVITSVALISPGEYGSRLVICLLGIGWALVLSLALWPLRAYTPLFQAVSTGASRLAELADAFWVGAATVKNPATNLRFAMAYDGLMGSLERSRDIWGAIRARRAGATTRSMQMLLLIEQLDDLGRTLVTLRQIVNLVGQEPWFTESRKGFEDLTGCLAIFGREISDAVAARGRKVDVAGLQSRFEAVEQRLAAVTSPSNRFHREELGRTTKHLVQQSIVLALIVSELKSGRPTLVAPAEARFGPRPRTFHPLAELRNSLSFRSSSFRHALRLASATTLAALLASAFHLARGYWIPLTVVLVLKPNFGGTLQRCVQRTTGTVLGALLAVLLLFAFRNPWMLVAGLAGLAFATFTLRNRNYGLFAMALTPTVMVMLDVTHPGTIVDSFLRILHTLIGSLLALASGYLLFPIWERGRLPVAIAGAFRAEAAFLRAFGSLLRDQEQRPMSEHRRDAAVAVSNAATAAERLLSEPLQRRGDVEASLTAVNQARQVLHALAALSDYPAREPVTVPPGDLTHLVELLAKALDDLAGSLQSGKDPEPWPDLLELRERLETSLTDPSRHQEGFPAAKNTAETRAWLFYHLSNVTTLALAARAVVPRLLPSLEQSNRFS